MASLPAGYIAPPLFSSRSDFVKSGRTIGCASSHHASTICVFPAPSKPPPHENRTAHYESNVYLVGPETLPLRSQLVSDTSVQWVKTREFFENERLLPEQYRPLLPDTLEGYSMTLKGHLRRLEEEGCSKSVIEHYQSIDAIFDLFLLMTAGRSDRGIFGEDLLDWLNRHYVSPTSEQGVHLADQEQPWLDANEFWPVLTKYAFRGIMPPLLHFLDMLQSHPSPFLKPLAKRLIAVIGKLPRATTTPKAQFAILKKQWVQLLASLRSEFESVPSVGKAEEWWAHLNDILHILEGDELVVRRIAREMGLGWLEVVCVWGLWGDDSLERHHMAEFTTSVVEDMPPDPKEIEERIMKEIFQEDFPAAAQSCLDLDNWLGAHLADLMQAEGLIESAQREGSDLSLRDYCILTYAESILNDPGQWMIAVDYMQSCGRVGLSTADEIVSRVTLDLSSNVASGSQVYPAESAQDAVLEATIIPVHAMRFCDEHDRDWVKEGLVKTAARVLANNGRLGEALSYSLSAEDNPGIDRVVGLAMEQYELKGGEVLINFVRELPSTLSSIRRGQAQRRWQSLNFLLHYAELHLHISNSDFTTAAAHLTNMFRQDMVPLRWWITLLKDAEAILAKEEDLYFSQNDAYVILAKVEDLETNYSRDRLFSVDPEPVQLSKQTMTSIRRALASYFARLVFGGIIS